MKKKLLLTILTTAVTLSLTACGGGNLNTESTMASIDTVETMIATEETVETTVATETVETTEETDATEETETAEETVESSEVETKETTTETKETTEVSKNTKKDTKTNSDKTTKEVVKNDTTTDVKKDTPVEKKTETPATPTKTETSTPSTPANSNTNTSTPAQSPATTTPTQTSTPAQDTANTCTHPSWHPENQSAQWTIPIAGSCYQIWETNTHVCNQCGADLGREDRKVNEVHGGYNITSDAKTVTCTEDGMTCGAICDCGQIIEATPMVIKATGHAMDTGCTGLSADGEHSHWVTSCLRCGMIEKEWDE